MSSKNEEKLQKVHLHGEHYGFCVRGQFDELVTWLAKKNGIPALCFGDVCTVYAVDVEELKKLIVDACEHQIAKLNEICRRINNEVDNINLAARCNCRSAEIVEGHLRNLPLN